MAYVNKKSEDYHKAYRLKNRESIRLKNKLYIDTNPWLSSYFNAKQRCNNKNNPNYKYYGEKGVLFLLSKKEIKEIWFRDKANLMAFPTIDRIDNDGNYEYSNCEFLENHVNSRKDKVFPKLFQYDLDNNFIKEWKSQAEVFQTLKIQQSDISKTIHGVINSAGGFIWKQEKKE